MSRSGRFVFTAPLDLRVLKPVALILLSIFIAAGTLSRAAAQTCEYNSSEPLRFNTDKSFIRDQHGRAVMFRGVNMGTCYYRDGIGFSEENLPGLSDSGFNFIRLNLGWDRLEKNDDEFDIQRLQKIIAFVEKAQEYGVYTMPDFHQMLWLAHIPKWMSDESIGRDHLSELSPVAAAQSDRFWEREALQDELIEFWEFLAGHFKGVSGIFGYDLFNEPFSIKGNSYGEFEKCCLFPFYEKAIPAVRAVDPDTIIVLEPHPQTVVLPAYTRPFDYENIVYSPHVYFPHSYGPSGLVINREETPADVRLKYQRFQKDAEKMEAPWLVGEYGGDPVTYPFAGPWLRENMKMMDRYLVGSAIWSYHDKGGEGWNINDGPALIKPHMADILVRPYPQYTAGTPEKLQYDPEKKKFRYLFDSDPGVCAPTEIFYPAELYRTSRIVVITDVIGCTISHEYDENRQIIELASTCDGPVEIRVAPE